ncbi:hypothetical protein C5167_003202 [Papaver somniferum]|uniref:AT-hook motif nuclear-localized protein n=1 Tax=Papaver somniferum TaxID=3469 RepID=A0A4Y7L240_PAPSO|nr:AT-hook motif nuclear-localized protein 28-like [Papaver somniferum]RZC79027.1 hypothetical protein C5167_003202 [Papaver somniferum]
MAEYGSGGISMSPNHQARECLSSEEDQNQDHQSHHHHSPRNSRALVLAPCSGGVGSNTGVTKSIYMSRNRDGSGGDDGDMRMMQMITSPESNDSPQMLSRKPRGRPPGSKNKPKPPIIITREVSRDDSKAMHPIILEISAGSDIIETVSQFSVKHHVCLSILSGSGSVANVILRHSTSTHHNATVSIPGCFEILSLSGSFIYPPASTKPSSSPPFSISLAGGQGQVVGGIIAGPLIAASSVFLMAASFVNPAFFRLPSCQNNEDHDHQDEEEINVKPKIDPNTGAVLSGNGGDETIYSGSTHHLPRMSQLLNSQIPSDVLPPWAPPSSRPY